MQTTINPAAVTKVPRELTSVIAASRDSILARFNRNVRVDGSGCHIWTGSTKGGYGRLNLAGRGMCLSHRIAYELYVGPIPPLTLVCHKCDVPSCVNPEHLFLGTSLDNMRDMASKGRLVRLLGPDNPRSKLTEAAVIEIRNRAANGEKDTRLGREFGVHHATIYSIVKRLSWRHVR